jgi:2-polyprenyl-3-methyl-5-hydroxy-6-metoxy-1,4-benzoquinol methylase
MGLSLAMDEQRIMTDAEIREAMKAYKFYHIIPLTETVSPPGNPAYVPTQQMFMKHLKSLDLKGKRVLDVGCRDGLFSFAAEKMGAAEVVGIDHDLSKPATEFLIPYFKSQVHMFEKNLYDLKAQELGLFDVILFPGVLYHLRYPFWGLKVLREMVKPNGELLIETAIWRGDPNNAMLFCPIDNDSPYEWTSCTFFNEKGLVDTLKSLGFDTVHVELLADLLPRSRRRSMMKVAGAVRNRSVRWAQQVRSVLTREQQLAHKQTPKIKIKDVTRAVFHGRFVGQDKNSLPYWEGTHRLHTEHGG